MNTTTVKDKTVTAKSNGSPYHFANRTQAENQAAKIPGSYVFRFPGGRPFYVAVKANRRHTGRFAMKPRITYAEFMDMLYPPSLFIYGEEPDFSNGWIYHHWALLGSTAAPAIWGL